MIVFLCNHRGVVDHRATAMSKTVVGGGGSESNSSAEDQVLNLSRSGNVAIGQHQMDEHHGSGSGSSVGSDDDQDLMTGRSYLKPGNDSD